MQFFIILLNACLGVSVWAWVVVCNNVMTFSSSILAMENLFTSGFDVLRVDKMMSIFIIIERLFSDKAHSFLAINNVRLAGCFGLL